MANKTAKFPPVYDADSFDLTDLIVDETNFRFFVHDPCNGISIADSSRCLMEDEFLLLQNGSIYILNQTIINQVDYCFELNNMHGRTLRVYTSTLFFAYLFLVIVQTSSEDIISSTWCIVIAFFMYFFFLASFYWLNVMCFDIWWTFGKWAILIKPDKSAIETSGDRVNESFIASHIASGIDIGIGTNTAIGRNLIIDKHRGEIEDDPSPVNSLCVVDFSNLPQRQGFRALRGSMKQRDQKKFIIYSIYAWGVASLFTGICLIMDFAPNIPEGSIRPQLGAERCWFKYNTATNIYFIGPMTISVFCNLCLFISTALKIQQHKRDTAHHLRSSESRRHDDNKQWFNLYLKLFIVMGITWSTEIISTLWKGSDNYIWYITDVVNTLQGLIIFITLVCKEKIKRLLLKRFGYNDNKFFSRNSTRSVYHSSASRTTCTTSSGLPLQDKVNANIRREPFGTSKESAEESDCP
ncbi:hypothetical protein HZH66_008464 [Vespula vulgaris]|uniref:G-protein coupled receptors family 2 profile 2 domain-containing protein n=1 Tax=Vespula vulgaris TaxID=7454 RepID=A0A834JQC7_VESVU|nr:hypothetical protein HZH66_008464 [Vespula vulgaris]